MPDHTALPPLFIPPSSSAVSSAASSSLTGHIDCRSDGHIHTRFCNHARGEMEEYVLAAIGRDLHSMTFLEHLEVGIHTDQRTWLTESDFDAYFAEGERLKEKYQDQIRIRLGVEAGFNPKAIDELREKLQARPFEQIGLSYHFYRSGPRHYNLVSRRKENLTALAEIGAERVIGDYFSSLLQAVECLSCDVLCHLDAVLRHLPHLRLTATHRQQIEELLDAMQACDIALEVNTSGFPLRRQPYPEWSIITAALTRNIRLVAGSDAHCPEQIGRYFDLLRANPELCPQG